SFTQPAAGSTVTVQVADTSSMTVGETLTVATGGTYQVSSITDGTHVVLKNLGTAGNGAAGASIAVGSVVSTPAADLDFSGTILKATGLVTLSIGDFVYVSGNFGFEKGANIPSVNLTDGTNGPGHPETTATNLSVLKIGASNVHAFVGLGGPYWIDSNQDGKIDSTDLPATTGATGLVIDDFSFALALLKPASDPTRSYYALTADAKSIKLVGVPGLVLSADSVHVEVNGSNDPAALPKVIDFASTTFTNDDPGVG